MSQFWNTLFEDLAEIRSEISGLIDAKRSTLAKIKSSPENMALRRKLELIDKNLQKANRKWVGQALLDDPREYSKILGRLLAKDKLGQEDEKAIRQVYAAQQLKAEQGELGEGDIGFWERIKDKIPESVRGHIDTMVKTLKSVKPLVIASEDQYKSPNRKMIRDQSGFPSSFSKTKSFGGVGGSKKNISYKRLSESAFNKKLDSVLKEDDVSSRL